LERDTFGEPEPERVDRPQTDAAGLAPQRPDDAPKLLDSEDVPACWQAGGSFFCGGTRRCSRVFQRRGTVRRKKNFTPL
jgi:hypothetical protein